MKNKEALDTLHDIKELMEKSTKFMSISGISAILVGIYACIGTGLVYFILNKQDSFDTLFNIPLLNINTTYQLASICLIALGVLVLSLLTTFTMSYQKAKKGCRNIFKDKSVHRLLWNFFLPLLTGGILCFSLIWQQYYGLTSSIMLIFYGLSRELFQVHLFEHTLLGLRRDSVRPRWQLHNHPCPFILGYRFRITSHCSRNILLL